MTLTLCGIEPRNEQQRQALELGQNFFNTNDPNRRIFKTTGYAGSGKSTIAFALAADQLHQGKQIAFTAPTHKALNVGRKIAANRGLTNIHFHTIHSLLGLSMTKVEGQKQLQATGTNSTFLYDTVWLDECSMVGQGLWGFVQHSFGGETRSLHHSTKLMLMGDPAQLYPVGEGKSPTFSNTLEGINLTEVVRQRQGSPLLDFVTQARRAVTRKAENYRPFRPRGLNADPKSEAIILKVKREGQVFQLQPLG
jgi:ATP-dependent exoDNAse (exonuclease V) alpha subunit